MPPKQCPECGRSLNSALVAGLDAAPAPCPGCGIELTAALLVPSGRPDPEPAVEPEAAPETEAAGETEAAPEDGTGASIRPPDLPPETVRDTPDDVLAGWDIGVDPAEVAAWRRDERPFPTDTLVVAGGAVVGTLAGLVAWSAHRGRGAAVGALTGVVVTAAGRRIWRLES